MVTDFQAAWTELMTRVAEGGPDGKKTSWGQNELLQEMGKIAGEYRVPEDLLEAASRLISGFPFSTQANPAETLPSSSADSVSAPAMDDAHRPPTDQGGHDGRAGREGAHGAPEPRSTRNGERRSSPPVPVG